MVEAQQFKDRLAFALGRTGMPKKKLADELGISATAMNKLLDGSSKSMTAENNSKAAAILGVSADWLATGQGEVTQVSKESHTTPKGQQVSLPGSTLEPQFVTWEGILSGQRPDGLFVVEVPDGAVSGVAEQGWEIVFEKGLAPEVGEPVVAIADGVPYIRLYAQRAGGGWRAAATSPVYLSFDSAECKLELYAAMRWHGKRRR